MKYLIVLGIRPDIINYQPIVSELNRRKFDFIFAKAILEHLPSEKIALDLFQLMNQVGNTILVAWHMKPKNKTKIMQVKGHFGKMIYQNYYKAKKFQSPDLSIRIKQVENYELWIVTKI